MSGQKTSYVRMDSNEVNRLRQMETNFRAVQSDLPNTLNQIRNDIRTQIAQQRDRTDARLRNIEQATENLRSDLAESERRQQQQLRQGLERVQHQMTEQIGQERAAREEQARLMQSEYRSLVADERNQRQREIKAVQDRLNTIENREEALIQMASAWIEDLKTVMAEVERLPHERFAPGRFERLAVQLKQVEGNLRQGASQTALGGAQGCYLDLIELRSDVLYQEQVFEQAFFQAIESVRSLLAEVEAHQNATAYSDSEKEFEFKVDFWSGGKFTDIIGEINRLEQRLEAEKDTLSTEQVRQLEAILQPLRERMKEAVESAKIAIINSQACYNVSQIVEDALLSQGYEIIEGVYEGEDQRNAYGLKMRNRVGDEVVTIVTPSTERQLEYKMQMDFFDTSQDEAMRQDFVKAVQTDLSRSGLQSLPSQTTREVDEPDESVRDFESFRRRRNIQEKAR